MSVWSGIGTTPAALFGAEGELVSVQIAIEARLLERLLDVLANLEFPINPEIRHAAGPATLVEFPAWSGRLDGIRVAVARAGFEPRCLQVHSMLEEIAGRASAGAGS
jgi:hypothetical protein